MLGKPLHEPPVIGLIPQAIQYYKELENEPEVSISVVESYGVKPNNIKLYDLLHEDNSLESTGFDGNLPEGHWPNMRGDHGLDPKTLSTVKVIDVTQGAEILMGTQERSHFAPTGKNPDSSRGHTVIIFTIDMPDEGIEEIDESRMIFADLAGSEGDTALTPKFISQYPSDVVLTRKLEAGVINTGLTQLKRIFTNLRKRGELASNDRTGLKRILYPFINTQSLISVMFMISPAASNAVSTNSTLRFAQEAAAIKVTPIKKKPRVNWKKIAGMLQLQKEQLMLITKGVETEEQEQLRREHKKSITISSSKFFLSIPLYEKQQN